MLWEASEQWLPASSGAAQPVGSWSADSSVPSAQQQVWTHHWERWAHKGWSSINTISSSPSLSLPSSLSLPPSPPSLPLSLSLSLSHLLSPGGDTIRQIQVQSGAHVELHRGAQPNPDEKLFNIRGNSQEIQMAQELIRQKYENMPVGGGGGGGGGGPQFGPGYVSTIIYTTSHPSLLDAAYSYYVYTNIVFQGPPVYIRVGPLKTFVLGFDPGKFVVWGSPCDYEVLRK